MAGITQDWRNDPVFLFNAAFGGKCVETARDAAIAHILLNPIAFVDGLASIVGGAILTDMLEKMQGKSLPRSIRTAAATRLKGIGLTADENQRIEAMVPDREWGGHSGTQPAVPDGGMREKYRGLISNLNRTSSVPETRAFAAAPVVIPLRKGK